VVPRDTPCWHPVYETRVRDRDLMVEIADVATAECPVSIISRYPEMQALVDDLRESEAVKEATGAFPFGLDSSKWPARWHDAVKIAQIESNRVEIARDKLSSQIS